MKYADLVAQVEQQAGWNDHRHARRVTLATIELLGSAATPVTLPPGASPRAGTAAEAEPRGPRPGQLEPCPGGGFIAFDLDTFLRRLARRTAGCNLEQAREHARAVFTALASIVHAGDLDGLACPLPPRWTELLAVPLTAAPIPAQRTPTPHRRPTTAPPHGHDRHHQDTDVLAAASSR